VNETVLNGNWNYRKDIGYMPQVARYPENMKVYELLDFIKGLRKQEPVFEQELIDQFALGPNWKNSCVPFPEGTGKK
jgi:Cu-processing system ATP-binding protein